MLDINRFYNGTCYDAYKWLGAQVQPVGVVFRTYAPNARGVNLLWNGMEIPMQKIWGGSFYEVYVEAARPTECYEYRIYTQSGEYADHSDPYGFGMQMRPDHQSVIRNLYD